MAGTSNTKDRQPLKEAAMTKYHDELKARMSRARNRYDVADVREWYCTMISQDRDKFYWKDLTPFEQKFAKNMFDAWLAWAKQTHGLPDLN
jgi:hypothetical protein